MARIGYVAHVVNSKRDINGNCYWFMTVTRTSDGAHATGIVNGGQSNCTYAVWQLAKSKKSEYTYTIEELPIREFKRRTKDMVYLGCTPDQIIPAILAQFKETAR